jgi:hypothetical protein
MAVFDNGGHAASFTSSGRSPGKGARQVALCEAQGNRPLHPCLQRFQVPGQSRDSNLCTLQRCLDARVKLEGPDRPARPCNRGDDASLREARLVDDPGPLERWGTDQPLRLAAV